MPKRDPFADKRHTSNTVKPTQAQQKLRNRRRRASRTKDVVEKEVADETAKLVKLEKEVAKKQEILDLMELAPSPSKATKLFQATCIREDFNPIEYMIGYAKNKKFSLRDRMPIIREIASYLYPKPKSIDLTADVKSSMEIRLVDFSKAFPKQMEQAIVDIALEEDDAYEEFVSPEEYDLRKRTKEVEDAD